MDSNQEKNESGIYRIILDSSFYFPRFIIFVKDLKDFKDSSFYSPRPLERGWG